MGQSPWPTKENLEQTKIHLVCERETNPTFKKIVATLAPHSHSKKKGENLVCVQQLFQYKRYLNNNPPYVAKGKR